ncbi:MAG: folylpolyglutamate synthase/dihydrofolate synthase family protein [Anaerovoracaceae bacterium]
MIKDAISKIAEFNRFGSVLGLERMESLLSRLSNPEKNLRIIHVAGTNGKGSTCRFLAHILKANGYKVGLYSSPFIEVFNERIEFDGKNISDEDLNRITDIVIKEAEEMVKDGEDSPTEFEIVTAIGFLYFKEVEADIVILEVGLGGRGDSTNVVLNLLISIITSISYDHTDRLGETLGEIAYEKAGIIKPNVPVVSNVSELEAAKVIAKIAYSRGSQLIDASKVKYTLRGNDLTGSDFDTVILDEPYRDLSISMIGSHQISNALTALTALEFLRKKGIIKVEYSKLKEGLVNAKNIGRFEVLRENPYYIIDGAHNEAGICAFVETVNKYLKGTRMLTVVGVLKDKDVDTIVAKLMEIKSDFIGCEPDNPRKLDKDKLGEYIKKANGNVIDCLSTEEAIKKVKDLSSEYDCILFVGSLYLIGEIRGRLSNGN